MSDAPVAYTDEERRQRRRRLTILLIPIVGLSVAGFVINIMAPALINDHPLVVISFQPINRYLILASNQVETWEFFLVSFVRLVLTDPLYFLLGRWYGDGALDWIEDKTGNTGVIPFVKKWFGRAGPAIVLIAPNAYVCVLAGAARMRISMVVALNVFGTIGRLILIKLTGNALEPVIDPVLNFIKRYQWQLVAVSFVIFTAQSIANRKKGKGEIESPGQMAEELEASIEAAESES